MTELKKKAMKEYENLSLKSHTDTDNGESELSEA